MYQQLISSSNFNPETMNQIKDLGFGNNLAFLSKLRSEMKVNDWYICESGGLPTGSSYHVTVVMTEPAILAYTSERLCIIPNDNTFGKYTDTPSNEDWKTVYKYIGYKNILLNQYQYCDAMLDAFWKLVFNKTASEMWCGGIVGAHGDKAYSYKRVWETQGIPFNRGVLLFLLTYTEEMDRVKYLSQEFVVDKYKHYLPKILEAEQIVFSL